MVFARDLEDELPDMLNHLICQRVDDFSHILSGEHQSIYSRQTVGWPRNGS